MVGYHKGNIVCNASTICALITRTSHVTNASKLSVSRIIKMFKMGFHFIEIPNLRDAVKSQLINHMQITSALRDHYLQPIITSNMTANEQYVRIALSRVNSVILGIITKYDPLISISDRIIHTTSSVSFSYTISVEQIKATLFSQDNLSFIGNDHFPLTIANRKIVTTVIPTARRLDDNCVSIIIPLISQCAQIFMRVIDLVQPELPTGVTLDRSMIIQNSDTIELKARVIDESRFAFHRVAKICMIQINISSPDTLTRKIVPMLIHESY
jgi:hypothetical protein